MDKQIEPGDLIRITDTSNWFSPWRFASTITWRVVRASSQLVLVPIMDMELPGDAPHLSIINNERNRNNIVIL